MYLKIVKCTLQLILPLVLLSGISFSQQGFDQSPHNSTDVLTGNGWAAPATSGTVNNGVIYAANEIGSDAGAQMQACLTAAAAGGRVCDSRGLGTTLSSASSITVPDNVTWYLPCRQVTFAAGTKITQGSGDHLIGCGRSVTILAFSGGTTYMDYGSGGSQSSTMSGFTVNGSSTAGSVGLYMTSAGAVEAATVSDVSITNIDLPLQVGSAVSGCDCYNHFFNVILHSSGAYGAKFVNQPGSLIWVGGEAWGGTSGMYVNDSGGGVFIYGVDIEFGSPGIDLVGSNNTVVGGYIATNPSVQIESGSIGSFVVGGGPWGPINDLNTTPDLTNFMWAQGTSFDSLSLKNLLYFGGFGTNYKNYFTLGTSGGTNPSLNGQYISSGGSPCATNGCYGHVPFSFGPGTIYGGQSSIGSFQTTALSNPGFLYVTPTGTTGSTTYNYWIDCIDKNGNKTAPFEGSTTTGNATLDGTNYNQIHWAPVDGCVSYDIMKGDTSHSIETNYISALSSPAGHMFVNDIGLATSAYTPAAANQTAEINGITWSTGASAPTGACTPPAIYLTSAGAMYNCESGSWVAK